MTGPEQEVLRPYVAFHAALRLAFAAFIGDISERCRSLLQHHLEVCRAAVAAWRRAAGKHARQHNMSCTCQYESLYLSLSSAYMCLGTSQPPPRTLAPQQQDTGSAAVPPPGSSAVWSSGRSGSMPFAGRHTSYIGCAHPCRPAQASMRHPPGLLPPQRHLSQRKSAPTKHGTMRGRMVPLT